MFKANWKRLGLVAGLSLTLFAAGCGGNNNDEANNKISIAYVAKIQNETDRVKKGDLVKITFKKKQTITDAKIDTEFKCTTLKDKDGQDVQNIIINE